MTEEFHVAALCWYSYVPFSLKHPLACFEKYHTLKICKKNCHEDKRAYFLKRIYEIPPILTALGLYDHSCGKPANGSNVEPQGQLAHLWKNNQDFFRTILKGRWLLLLPSPYYFTSSSCSHYRRTLGPQPARPPPPTRWGTGTTTWRWWGTFLSASRNRVMHE